MKKFSILFIVLFFQSISYPSDFSSLREIPIQEEGRLKPLDTFARNQLLRYYGKRSTGSDLQPVEWLIGISINLEKSTNLPVFNLRNPEKTKNGK